MRTRSVSIEGLMTIRVMRAGIPRRQLLCETFCTSNHYLLAIWWLPVASEINRVEPVQPRVGSDRNLAQRRPGAVFAAGVDCRGALRADREVRLIRTVKNDLHGVLALRNIGCRLLEFRNFIARKILTHAIAAPDAVNFSREDLTGIKVKSNFHRPAGTHVLEVLLVVGCKHVAVSIDDQGRDSAN